MVRFAAHTIGIHIPKTFSQRRPSYLQQGFKGAAIFPAEALDQSAPRECRGGDTDHGFSPVPGHVEILQAGQRPAQAPLHHSQ